MKTEESGSSLKAIDNDTLLSLLEPLIAIARKAGEAIEQVERDALHVHSKQDHSPVTVADYAANEIIVNELATISHWPILSEESAAVPFNQRKAWDIYWLIDPLDGTKEYIRGSSDYTVNIALIHQHQAKLGVIVKPQTSEAWFGVAGHQSWYQKLPGATWQEIEVSAHQDVRIVASRSHQNEATKRFIECVSPSQLLAVGSSLKCCLIAQGEADLYPRYGPTSEWDTAAAQAILEGAGGAIIAMDSLEPIRYNTKESLLNTDFLACSHVDYGKALLVEFQQNEFQQK